MPLRRRCPHKRAGCTAVGSGGNVCQRVVGFLRCRKYSGVQLGPWFRPGNSAPAIFVRCACGPAAAVATTDVEIFLTRGTMCCVAAPCVGVGAHSLPCYSISGELHVLRLAHSRRTFAQLHGRPCVFLPGGEGGPLLFWPLVSNHYTGEKGNYGDV